VAQDNHRLRKVVLTASEAVVSTFAGSGACGAGAGGFADGDVSIAQFKAPNDVYCHRATKTLFVAGMPYALWTQHKKRDVS
jgi:hypothetical protein